MKNYLNGSEKLKILAFLKVVQMSEDFIEGNLLDKKEKADMKRSMTYLSKTILKVMERLNTDAKKSFKRTIQNYNVYCASKSELDIFVKKRSSDIEKAYEENKDYMKLVELIMFYNCNDCKKPCTECEFYKEFENNHIPELQEGDKPCKYSYTLKIVDKEK